MHEDHVMGRRSQVWRWTWGGVPLKTRGHLHVMDTTAELARHGSLSDEPPATKRFAL